MKRRAPLAARPAGGLGAERTRLLRLAGAASLGVALVLIGLKSWAVVATGSVALLSSLADSALDLVASMITFVALRVAVEPPDREHRFGHGKSEAIAGLLQAVIISVSALFVAIRAVQRLIDPAPVTAPALGTGVMLASLALTGGLVVLQRYVIRRTGSLAVSADSIHYVTDLATGIAVLVALFLSGYGDWPLADPLLGLAIAVVILVSARNILVAAVDVLLDRELPDSARARIHELALAGPGVLGVTNLRTRSAGATLFIELNIEIDEGTSIGAANEISIDVERRIAVDFPEAEVAVRAVPRGA